MNDREGTAQRRMAHEHGFRSSDSTTLLKSTGLNLSVYFLWVGVTASSSLFVTSQHSHHSAGLSIGLSAAYLLLVLLPAGSLLFLVRARLLRRLLGHPLTYLLLLAALGVYDELRFLQYALPHSNLISAAPALMNPARRLLHGQDPYGAPLHGGAPISPGPGWLLLLSPLTLSNGAGLLTALSALSVALLLAKRSPHQRGLFVLLLLLEPVPVQISLWGTDLFAIPIVFAALCLLAELWTEKPTRLMLLGVGAGLFAQSRVPMIPLLVILTWGVWRRSKRDARNFGTAAFATCLGMYAFFYLWTVHDQVFFQPLHLLSRNDIAG